MMLRCKHKFFLRFLKVFVVAVLVVYFWGKSLRKEVYSKIQLVSWTSGPIGPVCMSASISKFLCGMYHMVPSSREQNMERVPWPHWHPVQTLIFCSNSKVQNAPKRGKNEEAPPVEGLYVKCASDGGATNFFGKSLGSLRLVKRRRA